MDKRPIIPQGIEEVLQEMALFNMLVLRLCKDEYGKMGFLKILNGNHVAEV